MATDTAAATMRANPYVGPRAIESGEALFGRDTETVDLLNQVIADRVVLMYAVSGAGKTSLLKAGLIPGLESRGFAPLPIVQVRDEPPPGSAGNRYTLSVLQRLEAARPESERLPGAVCVRLTLEKYLADRFPDGLAGKVLVFDQFEDVLRIDPTDDAVKEAFFRDVGAALRTAGLRAVFSMREEYVAGLDPYVRHVPTRLSSRFRLSLLGPEAAREAVCGPAEAVGIPFRPDAARELVAQLGQVRVQRYDGTVETKQGPTVEPVQLQVVCQLVWDRLPRGATEIGPQVLDGFSVDRALEQYYTAKVKAAAELGGVEEGRVRRWVEKTLITEQRLRGQVLKGTPDTAGLANAAIDGLVGAYLVRSEQRLGGTWFELTHDRLVDPIRQSNRAWFATRLRPFQLQADQWAARPEAERSGLMLNGVALSEAEQWAKDHPGEVRPTDEEFLEQSRRARTAGDRVRTAVYRWWAVFSTVGLVVGLALLAWALWERGNATRHAKQADDEKQKADLLREDVQNQKVVLERSLAAQTDLYTQMLDTVAVQASKLATADDPNAVLMAGFAWEQLYKVLWPDPMVRWTDNKTWPPVYSELTRYLASVRRSPRDVDRNVQNQLSYVLASRLREALLRQRDPTTVHILTELRKGYFKAAVDVTNSLANAKLNEGERRTSVDSFLELYWVKLALVEGDDVKGAMVDFKSAVEKPEPRARLKVLATALDDACRKELETPLVRGP